MADVFALALILGALYLFTQSFLICALVHATYNMMVSVFMQRGIIPRPVPADAE